VGGSGLGHAKVMFGSAVGTSTSPLPNQANRCSNPVSPGPEMKPSSDMLAPVMTVLMMLPFLEVMCRIRP
jgi:hypothetical protein